MNEYVVEKIEPEIDKIKDYYTGEKYNLLIVENKVEMQVLLQEELKNDYNVFYAVNGKEALKKLSKIPKPDMIISDVMMDEIDGLEFYDIFHLNKNNNEVPFIFISAKSQIDDVLEGLKKGAVDYISKPFHVEVLKYKIKNILLVREAFKEENLKIIEKPFFTKLNKQKKFFDKSSLSHQEIKCLSLLKMGFIYKEIGYELKISVNTVKTHFFNIRKKYNVENNTELLLKLKNF